MYEHERTTLLITGISGYIGLAVAPLAVRAGHQVTGTYLQHAPDDRAPQGGTLQGCDLHRASIEEIPALIESLRPDVILHTAAAWRTEAEAQAVIVEGTRGVVSAASRTGARIVHMSTDLVFDGEHAPYVETDPPAPVNFYGAAKAEAERIVSDAFGKGHPERSATESKDAPSQTAATIVRTSLVTCFDPPDPRTVPVLQALRGERAPVTLFTDEYRCPVRVEDLAAALAELIDRPFAGILHIAGPERLSRYDLGLRIARFYGLSPAPGITPGLAADSGMPRPRDCTLSIARARQYLQTGLHPLPLP